MKIALALSAMLVAFSANAQTTPLLADGAGLVMADGARIDFGAEVAGTTDAVSVALGDGPSNSYHNDECGAGPMDFVEWPNGLTLMFQDGALSGWLTKAEAGVDTVPTTSGLRPAMAKADIPGATFEETSLGIEFQAGEIFGILGEGDRVELLWAGTSCFFR
jgi:hypothetical protein